jgi:hypothetical protein
MAARLVFGVLAQLAGQILELVQGEPSTRMLASKR